MSQKISWPLANTIIWLNYPLHKVLRRFFIRTTIRVFTRKKVCGNNYETIENLLFTKDSLLHWIIMNKGKKRKRFTKWRKGEFRDKNWIEIRNNRDYRTFFQHFDRDSGNIM